MHKARSMRTSPSMATLQRNRGRGSKHGNSSQEVCVMVLCKTLCAPRELYAQAAVLLLVTIKSPQHALLNVHTLHTVWVA